MHARKINKNSQSKTTYLPISLGTIARLGLPNGVFMPSTLFSYLHMRHRYVTYPTPWSPASDTPMGDRRFSWSPSPSPNLSAPPPSPGVDREMCRRCDFGVCLSPLGNEDFQQGDSDVDVGVGEARKKREAGFYPTVTA